MRAQFCVCVCVCLVLLFKSSPCPWWWNQDSTSPWQLPSGPIMVTTEIRERSSDAAVVVMETQGIHERWRWECEKRRRLKWHVYAWKLKENMKEGELDKKRNIYHRTCKYIYLNAVTDTRCIHKYYAWVKTKSDSSITRRNLPYIKTQ